MSKFEWHCLKMCPTPFVSHSRVNKKEKNKSLPMFRVFIKKKVTFFVRKVIYLLKYVSNSLFERKLKNDSYIKTIKNVLNNDESHRGAEKTVSNETQKQTKQTRNVLFYYFLILIWWWNDDNFDTSLPTHSWEKKKRKKATIFNFLCAYHEIMKWWRWLAHVLHERQ